MAEKRAQEHLSAQGWRVLAANIECLHVQVDLLARDPDGILTVVEVKYEGRFEARLTPAQNRRLNRVCAILAQYEPVQLVLARVNDGQILLTPVDGLTP